MGLENLKILAKDNGELRYFIDAPDLEKMQNLESQLEHIENSLKKHSDDKYLNCIHRMHHNHRINYWFKIFNKYSISPDGNYIIDLKTGELTESNG